MDGLQQQTAPEAQAQVPAQSDINNGVPQFDPTLMPQIANPEAMTGVLAGQGFMADPSMVGMPMGDASVMMPIMFPNGQIPAQEPAKAVSAEEIALYDRQIRLWGMAAQAKIQNANILLITMRALANEVAKNLVLAGVGSLTILDSALVSEVDLGAQFFQSEDATTTATAPATEQGSNSSNSNSNSHIGQNRAEAAAPALRKLNPRVSVHVDAEGVKNKGPSYFSAFDVVIATDLDPDSFNLINTATRINGKSFYAAGTHGLYGFIFSDLIEHEYVIEREAGNVATEVKQETRTRSVIDVQTKREGGAGGKTMESVTKRELYSTWFLASDLAGLPAEYTSSRRRLRAVSPALSCLRALWAFMQMQPPSQQQQQQQNRLPATREDLKLFTQLATQKHKALGLPSETLRPEFLRSFLQGVGSEVAPVAAIIGGQLAQDVINVLGRRQQPIQNMVVFDGTTMEAPMYPLHPEGALGSGLLSGVTAADAAAVAAAAAAANGVGAMGLPVDMNGIGLMPPNGFPLDLNASGGGAVAAGFAQNGLTAVPDASASLQQQQQALPLLPPHQPQQIPQDNAQTDAAAAGQS